MEFGSGSGMSLTLLYRATDAGGGMSEVRLCTDSLFHPQLMGKSIELIIVTRLSSGSGCFCHFLCTEYHSPFLKQGRVLPSLLVAVT